MQFASLLIVYKACKSKVLYLHNQPDMKKIMNEIYAQF